MWSLFAAVGLFVAGGAFSITHGVNELRAPTPADDFVVGYVVLAVSFVLEGTSFLQSVRQARAAAQAMQRDLIEHVMATSDPTLRAVFAEDAAALIESSSLPLPVQLPLQPTGSPVPERHQVDPGRHPPDHRRRSSSSTVTAGFSSGRRPTPGCSSHSYAPCFTQLPGGRAGSLLFRPFDIVGPSMIRLSATST